jgi:hypothetical protein
VYLAGSRACSVTRIFMLRPPATSVLPSPRSRKWSPGDLLEACRGRAVFGPGRGIDVEAVGRLRVGWIVYPGFRQEWQIGWTGPF